MMDDLEVVISNFLAHVNSGLRIAYEHKTVGYSTSRELLGPD